MKNRLLIIVSDNTSLYEIIEQLSNIYKIVVPKKETTDESLSFYSSFFNLLEEDDFFDLMMNEDSKIKSFGYTKCGLAGYKSNSIGQGYADLYNGKGRVILLHISKEELSFYSHFYSSSTFVGFASDENEKIKMQKALDDVIIQSDESTKEFSSIIDRIITSNPYVYEKK